MKIALNWLIDRHNSGTVLICTDIQALLGAIDSYSDSVSEVIDLLNKTLGLGVNPSVATRPLWRRW